MTKQEVLAKIKKNSQLSRPEKKELSEFWENYVCPVPREMTLQVKYHDEEEWKECNAGERLDFFYDEQPWFIERLFEAMAKGEEFATRFSTYRPEKKEVESLNVS